MPRDTVERLRWFAAQGIVGTGAVSRGEGDGPARRLSTEAADEIERLRSENAALRRAVQHLAPSKSVYRRVMAQAGVEAD